MTIYSMSNHTIDITDVIKRPLNTNNNATKTKITKVIVNKPYVFMIIDDEWIIGVNDCTVTDKKLRSIIVEVKLGKCTDVYAYKHNKYQCRVGFVVFDAEHFIFDFTYIADMYKNCQSNEQYITSGGKVLFNSYSMGKILPKICNHDMLLRRSAVEPIQPVVLTTNISDSVLNTPSNVYAVTTTPATINVYLQWYHNNSFIVSYHLAILQRRYDILAFILNSQPDLLCNVIMFSVQNELCDWLVQWIIEKKIDTSDINKCYIAFGKKLIDAKYAVGSCKMLASAMLYYAPAQLQYLVDAGKDFSVINPNCVSHAYSRGNHTLAKWFMSLGCAPVVYFDKYPELSKWIELNRVVYYDKLSISFVEHYTISDFLSLVASYLNCIIMREPDKYCILAMMECIKLCGFSERLRNLGGPPTRELAALIRANINNTDYVATLSYWI